MHIPTAPALLWLGNHEFLTQQAIAYVQQQLCPQLCHICRSCNAIRQLQHPALVWIYPEKGYTLAHIQEIHERIIFDLAEDEQVFFILHKADQLSPQCANSLLKSLEEPPRGYQFILCAQQLEPILPTIRSRCIITSYLQEGNSALNQFAERFFLTTDLPDPNELSQTLHKQPLSEHQAVALLDTLVNHWRQAFNQAVARRHHLKMHTAQNMVHKLEKLYKSTPMPGSSSLFVKHLFLIYHTNH